MDPQCAGGHHFDPSVFGSARLAAIFWCNIYVFGYTEGSDHSSDSADSDGYVQSYWLFFPFYTGRNERRAGQLLCVCGKSQSYVEMGYLSRCHEKCTGSFDNYVGTHVPSFFSGFVVIETVFAYPGLGNMIVNAIPVKDYPVLMGGILVTGIVVIISMLLVDLIDLALNPKLRKAVTR